MSKPRVVHKYAGDDLTATRTACGLDIYDRMVRRYSLTINGELMYRYAASPPLVVDADVRRVTCGNCARVEPFLNVMLMGEYSNLHQGHDELLARLQAIAEGIA